MPCTAMAGRTSFLLFVFSYDVFSPDTNSESPLIQAFSPIPVQGAIYCDCIKVGRKIDPPYNMGSDFIYEDDFSQSATDYADNSGQTDEEGNRLVQNAEGNGRFHTDWLNMLYPRLRLAKDLLSDDGVISIDDNEQENLKKICGEIFGSQNFVGCIILQTATDNNPRQTNTEHEYMLCYAKK